MTIPPNLLRLLKNALYLEQSAHNAGKVIDIKLLRNGKRFSEQIAQQWQNTKTINSPADTKESHAVGESFNAENRLDFINSQQLRSNIGEMVTKSAVIKSRCKTNTPFIMDSHSATLRLDNHEGLCLVTDCLFSSEQGIQNFYNLQRERKIWWMRFSSNPSRYSLEPFVFSTKEKEFCNKSQSITINSRFPFGTFSMEHITLVPLSEVDLYIQNHPAPNRPLPVVIRSVIDLGTATCAMLLDGCDHTRGDILLLSKKLVPIQCSVFCLQGDKPSTDLKDLGLHLSLVIHRAGLRLPDDIVSVKDNEDLETELQKADSVGIPYSLLIGEKTLENGMLQLRNRNTTLQETIHISDIPSYLLKLFLH